MPLTNTQRLELTEPFEFGEHGFVPQRDGDEGGNPYLFKHVIHRRLDRVCPNWSMGDPHLVAIHEDTVIMRAALTIEGQAHSDVGTGIIQRYKSDGTLKSPYDVSREVSKAFKTAASDCFPRCCVHFGIGWYLRSIPKEWKNRVKTPQGLKEYLMAVRAAWEKAQGDLDRARERMNAEPVARRIGGPDPRETPPPADAPPAAAGQVQATPPVYQCYEVAMQKRANGDGFKYVLHCAGGVNIVAYTGDKFRDVGFKVDAWKRDKHVERFNPPLLVIAEQTQNGWRIDRIEDPSNEQAR